MAQKIYTRTGDSGTTSLIGGTKVPKSHLRIEAYGTIDELNSYIGLCRDLLGRKKSGSALKEIQDRLFTIGSSLACDPVKAPRIRIPDLDAGDITFLESAIDRMNEVVPELKHFVLPGGHPLVAHLHVARCISRRAERCCVRLEQESLEVDPLILQYLNRLSDYLFVLSRYTAHQLHVKEIPWKPRVRQGVKK